VSCTCFEPESSIFRKTVVYRETVFYDLHVLVSATFHSSAYKTAYTDACKGVLISP